VAFSARSCEKQEKLEIGKQAVRVLWVGSEGESRCVGK